MRAVYDVLWESPLALEYLFDHSTFLPGAGGCPSSCAFQSPEPPSLSPLVMTLLVGFLGHPETIRLWVLKNRMKKCVASGRLYTQGIIDVNPSQYMACGQAKLV